MKYAMLVQQRREVPDGAARLEVPDGASLDDVAAALERLLAARPSPDGAVLVVGGRTVGATGPDHLRTLRALGVVRSAGEEDRAHQPAESTQYTLLMFRCASCERTAATAFYDERYRPLCETPGHGPMDLR